MRTTPLHKRKRAVRVRVACAVGALAVAGLAAIPITALADTTDDAPASRQQTIQAAAQEYHVPANVLLALAYEESAWNPHGTQASTGGGYGIMHLTDVTPAMLAAGPAGAAGRADLASLADDPALHTLQTAAKLTGLSAQELREDETANIRGGAALLASYEKELVGDTPADASRWYGAVARYSQSKQRQGAASFADRVFDKIRGGKSATTRDGQQVRLTAAPSVDPATSQVAKLRLKSTSAADTECPPTVRCTFVAGSPAGGQVSDRPANGIRIDTIVLHDLESTYDAGVKGLADPTNPASTHYVMDSDGSVTQMVPTRNVAFHAGNYSTNLHSVGIEHEGYAAHGSAWYTEAQYEATADLVKYLAARFGIPLDRQHVIGHDNVAGPKSSLVSGMHWDMGPELDIAHLMDLAGAPATGPRGVPRAGEVVTIDPPFARNEQTVTVCPQDDPTGQTKACAQDRRKVNFVHLRTSPSSTAPLFGD
ncbi:hypothetical protein GCM10010431_73650 [Streptomyces kunmingensis]|nr:N-acetylmuramoyl-L-alanine amidase [Streptomyces kunmingensis]